MIILGIVILVIGFVAQLGILWLVGMVTLIAGLVLMLMGRMGRPVRGRRHYF